MSRVLAFLLLALTPSLATAQTYDVVIRGGRVLDGSGNPWYRTDIAIIADRIAAVGALSQASAREVIDATGLYVAPGFIDPHSHAGEGLTTSELSHGRPLLAQGITTVLVNPDGGGPVDIAAQREALLEHGLGVNVAQLVPHGTIREQVLGFGDAQPDADQLSRMRDLVRRGMEAGGWGLSSGLFYAPASYSETEEVVELAEVAAEYGGVYTSHIRDESTYTVGLIEAVDEVIRVAREAQMPGVITHVKALGPHVWGFSAAILHRIERARAEGLEIYTDQYPYNASGSSVTSALVPRWAQVGGHDSIVARIRDPEIRPRVREGMLEGLDRRGGADRLQFRRHVADPSIEGRTLQEVADERGLDPIELAMEILEAGGAAFVSFNMHDEDVRRFMRQPWTMTGSDGGLVAMGEGVPHPRSYGTYPRKLRKFVVEEGVLDLGHAIRSMTGLPAAAFRMRDRGSLTPGAMADIVVFDLEALDDPATFQQPHQLARGMVHVLVNGQPAIRDGEFTGAMSGRVLRRSGASAAATHRGDP